MALHVLAADLAKWDEADARDALLLPFFADERPLRGAAGLADWRLNGRLSRLLKARRASGAAGETVMMPPGRRLRFARVMLFGLGDSRGYTDDRYRADVRRIRAVTDEAGISEYAIQAPGRATGLLGARRALELWIDEAERDGRQADVTLIDDPAGSKDMAELLRHAR
jgi:Cytosol aminopeptidase family, N-terminal domain